jgi:four helix bundle protein
MTERPHEKLEIYRKAHELALQAHKLSLALPSFERFEEGSQLRRAAKSVSAQIVEGHALRRYKADYVRFLWRAYASAEETIEHLRYITETVGSNKLPQAAELAQAFGGLASNIFNYIVSVEQKHDTQFYVKEDEGAYEDEKDRGIRDER